MKRPTIHHQKDITKAKVRPSEIYSGWESIPRGKASDKIQKGCLVIEGGAFRGLYNQGTLDAFMLNDINIETVIGVSAGALAGINYVAGQIGRSARINLKYRHDPRYIGREALHNGHSLLDVDFLLKTCDAMEPFAMDAFLSPKRKFVAVATNCKTGKPAYFATNECKEILKAVKASASMPYISPMVDVEGTPCLDGGCSCSIAYQWALDQGYEKILVIKTRDRSFRVEEKERVVAEKLYRNYPEFAQSLKYSDANYNKQCDELEVLEKEGRIYLIAPSSPITVGRLERDMEKLGEVYWLGYEDALKQLDAIKDYLES